MTGLVLTHAYFIGEDPAEAKVMKPYPPLGLLYISAYLKARGHEVTVLDATFMTRAEYFARLAAQKPKVVGIYATLMTRRNAIAVAVAARALGAKVVMGGPEPVNYAEEYLSSGADVVVAGEGEETLAELLPKLADGADLGAVAGIVFRAGDGTLVRTPPRAMLPKLDELPLPDREAIGLDHYVDTWRRYHGKGSVSLITARGCPYTCRWCSHSVYGFSHRRRSPASVADELEYLQDRYAPDQVWYADDVFTINRRWLYEFAGELEQRRLRFPFETITREDRLNEKVVETLAAMGCYRIWIGAESGSQRILDAMDRRTDALRMRDMIRLLQRHGIRAGTFIMVGYEGETWQDLDATARHLRESLPDDLLTTLAYPIKGTPYFEDVADRIIAPHGWAESSDRELTVAGRRSRRFYRYAQGWLRAQLDAAREDGSAARSPARSARRFLASAKYRAGMYLTRHETEQGA